MPSQTFRNFGGNLATVLRSGAFKICLSQALQGLADRIWDFVVTIYMIEFMPSTLQYTALYEAIASFSLVVLGPYIGRWVDKTHRMKALDIMVTINAFSILCSVAVVLAKLKIGLYYKTQQWVTLVSNVLVVLLAVCSRLAATGCHIILYQDWIVVLAGKNLDLLTSLNTKLQTVELTTYVCGPLIGGALLHYSSSIVTGTIVAVWNILALLAEHTLLKQTYLHSPALQKERKRSLEWKDNVGKIFQVATYLAALFVRDSDEDLVLDIDSLDDVEIYGSSSEDEEVKQKCLSRCTATNCRKFLPTCHYLRIFFGAVQIYFQQTISYAGVGMSLICLSVMGIDDVTKAYMYSQGVPKYLLGLISAAGFFMGALGATCFPYIRMCAGLRKSGIIGFVLKISLSLLCVVSIWMPGSPFKPKTLTMQRNFTLGFEEHNIQVPASSMSLCVFGAGAILSRFGIWILQLAVTQIMQETVSESKRGTVNGVQESFNMLCELLISLVIYIYHDPKEFGMLIIISVVASVTGFVIYSIYLIISRGEDSSPNEAETNETPAWDNSLMVLKNKKT